jgi:hypothetical protein
MKILNPCSQLQQYVKCYYLFEQPEISTEFTFPASSCPYIKVSSNSIVISGQATRADAIAARVRHTLDKAKDPFHEIVKASKYQEKYFFGNTFEFTRQVDNHNRYLALIHKCFYNDFFRRNGAPELMKIACQWDFISWSKGIEPEKHHVSFFPKISRP